jgi:hypothetical protein
MLEATVTDYAPWQIVLSEDKKRARLNCISHLLSQIPYEKLPQDPECSTKETYDAQASLAGRRFVPEKY